MVEKFIEAYPDVSEDDLRNDPETKLWLSTKSEELKRNLSSEEETETVFDFRSNMVSIELTRQKFEELTSDLLGRTIDLTQQVLDVKGLTPDRISEIVLVGGSTYMPQIRVELEKTFGISLVQYEPDEAVARGAAYVAGNIMAIADEEAENSGQAEDYADGSEQPQNKIRRLGGSANAIELEDIINKTYGVEALAADDKTIISNLLIKDTPISEAQADDVYGTSVANQKTLHIGIYESESREKEIDPDYAVNLAEYTISLEGANLPAHSPIKIEFKLNDSGLLDIKVTDVKNNRTYPNTVKIANCHTEEELEEIIGAVKNRRLK
jgi:molecular chaperone DnaK (HSP70)